MSRIVAVALLLLAAPALGHGDASWIMASQDTRWCCSERDCSELHHVTATKNGWAFPSPKTGEWIIVPFGFKSRYPSIDEHFWVCLYPSGEVRCFFTAPDGV